MKNLFAALCPESPPLPFHSLRFKFILLWMVLTAGAFHLAYAVPALACLTLLYLFGLIQLSRVRTSRHAMNIGWVLGLVVYGPQLSFFWGVFGPGAITLWLVLAFWLGLFLVTLRQTRLCFGPFAAAALAPVLWLGFEFFRSELYYLKFTWLNAGYAFANSPLLIAIFGVYGIGFALMILASALDRAKPLHGAIGGGLALCVIGFAANHPSAKSSYSVPSAAELRVAGVQLEFPGLNQVMVALERLRKTHRDTDVFVLSEYTFDGPVPDKVRAWCRANSTYLVAGGKDMLTDGGFRNTAFVIGPDGQSVFQQAKSMPIQFFKDGRPALSQRLWDSPWGRIAIPTCYDLSYSTVVDRFVSLGAQAIINPTMDVEDWGEQQHRMHSRVPLVRAAEHGLPIFRVASSGISQLVSADGREYARAPFAKEEAQISGTLSLPPRGRVPYDRMIAQICVAVTALVAGSFGLAKACRWAKQFMANRRCALAKPKPSEGVAVPTE